MCFKQQTYRHPSLIKSKSIKDYQVSKRLTGPDAWTYSSDPPELTHDACLSIRFDVYGLAYAVIVVSSLIVRLQHGPGTTFQHGPGTTFQHGPDSSSNRAKWVRVRVESKSSECC